MVPGELGKRDGARGCSLMVCKPWRFPPPEPRPSISREDSILSNNCFGITSPASPPSTIHDTRKKGWPASDVRTPNAVTSTSAPSPARASSSVLRAAKREHSSGTEEAGRCIVTQRSSWASPKTPYQQSAHHKTERPSESSSLSLTLGEHAVPSAKQGAIHLRCS